MIYLFLHDIFILIVKYMYYILYGIVLLLLLLLLCLRIKTIHIKFQMKLNARYQLINQNYIIYVMLIILCEYIIGYHEHTK